MIYWALWKNRRGLQFCSLTWEIGCNFLNHFGSKKKGGNVRESEGERRGHKYFEAFPNYVKKKNSKTMV